MAAALPQKRYFRQRAHSNPIADHSFDYPVSPIKMNWRAQYPEFLSKHETSKVEFADIGCGYGGLLVELSPMFPEVLMVGFEIRIKVSDYVMERIQALRQQHPDVGVWQHYVWLMMVYCHGISPNLLLIHICVVMLFIRGNYFYNEMAHSKAVAVYDETFLTPFYKPVKTVILGKESVNPLTLNIKQDWTKLGVAGVVWDAALVLSEYLHTHPHLLSNKSVLELGAGTGLVGITASCLGAKSVAITDRDHVVDLVRENVHTNFKPPSCNYAQPNVFALNWGENLEALGSYDVILGADIVYVEESFPSLLKTLQQLSTPSTLIILSCKIRYEKDVKFLQNMRAHSFHVEHIKFNNCLGIDIYGVTKK